MLGCAAHRWKAAVKQRSALMKWKRNKRDTSTHMGAIGMHITQYDTYRTELRVQRERVSSFKMETIERDNYLNLCLVGGYECSICVVFTRSLRFSILQCCCCCYSGAAALLLDLFSCRSLLFPIICNYAALYEWDWVCMYVSVCVCAHTHICVGVNATTRTKNETTTLWIYCVHIHTYDCWNNTIFSFSSHTVRVSLFKIPTSILSFRA